MARDNCDPSLFHRRQRVKTFSIWLNMGMTESRLKKKISKLCHSFFMLSRGKAPDLIGGGHRPYTSATPEELSLRCHISSARNRTGSLYSAQQRCFNICVLNRMIRTLAISAQTETLLETVNVKWVTFNKADSCSDLISFEMEYFLEI